MAEKKNGNEFISPFSLIASFFSLCSCCACCSPHRIHVILIHVVKYTQRSCLPWGVLCAVHPNGRIVLLSRSSYLMMLKSSSLLPLCVSCLFSGIIPSTWVSWRNKVINYRKAFPTFFFFLSFSPKHSPHPLFSHPVLFPIFISNPISTISLPNSSGETFFFLLMKFRFFFTFRLHCFCSN